MLKTETIWHHLLFEAVQNHQFKHTQKDLALQFGFSLSTVNHALHAPSRIGAVRKETKFFVLASFQKLLYLWASLRNLKRDLIYQTYSPAPVNEIEGLAPPQAIYAGYSAAKRILGEPPADHSQVHLYLPPKFLPDFQQRFPLLQNQPPNVFVLKTDPQISQYGQITTLPQTFVDIWNLPDWYSHDFTQALEEKINGLLS